MPVRDGVLLLLALLPGLVEDDLTAALVDYLRNGTRPAAAETGTVKADGTPVLAGPGAVDRVTGVFGAGTVVQVWRRVGVWCFVSDDRLAGWLHAAWFASG